MNESNIYPDLLIIADDDLTYGIDHGYYPEMKKKIKTGVLKVCSLDSDYSGYNLSKRPQGENDFYVRNQFSNEYIPLFDSNTTTSLLNDKSFVIKETLVKMGAKHITLIEDTKDVDSTKTHIGTEVKVPMYGDGNLEINSERFLSVDLKSCIESHDPNRKAKSANEVKNFMKERGLLGDTNLTMLLNRLEGDGQLHGTEEYTVEYLTEIKNAFDIAAGINCRMFNCTFDFKNESNRIHIIKQKLKIEFD